MNQNQFNPIQQEDQLSPNNSEPIQIDSLEISLDKISPENDRFPYCIVWTALPFITWILPFIGHTGIALSNGVIHDFAGPYTISVDNFAFGKPLKYVKLKTGNMTKEKYDNAITKADNKYCQMMVNILFVSSPTYHPYLSSYSLSSFYYTKSIISFGKDSFSFQTDCLYINIIKHMLLQQTYAFLISGERNRFIDALNQMSYQGKTNWNMVSVWFICLSSSNYVSWWALIQTYLPIMIIIGVSLLISIYSN